MPLHNHNPVHLTGAEWDTIMGATVALETALAAVNYNLSPEERQSLGSIDEKNKGVVNRVKQFYDNNPSLSSPEVNWNEFTSDYNSRINMEDLQSRLQSLQNRLRDARILHDHDNYHAALNDYAYTQFKTSSSAAGYSAKYDELKQFFVQDGDGGNSEPPPTE